MDNLKLPQSSKDLQRLIFTLIAILVSAFLVGYGRINAEVFVVILSGASAYYFGLKSDTEK